MDLYLFVILVFKDFHFFLVNKINHDPSLFVYNFELFWRQLNLLKLILGIEDNNFVSYKSCYCRFVNSLFLHFVHIVFSFIFINFVDDYPKILNFENLNYEYDYTVFFHLTQVIFWFFLQISTRFLFFLKLPICYSHSNAISIIKPFESVEVHQKLENILSPNLEKFGFKYFYLRFTIWSENNPLSFRVFIYPQQ